MTFTAERPSCFYQDMNENQQETLAMFDALIAKIEPRRDEAADRGERAQIPEWTAFYRDVYHFWQGYLACLYDLRDSTEGLWK